MFIDLLNNISDDDITVSGGRVRLSYLLKKLDSKMDEIFNVTLNVAGVLLFCSSDRVSGYNILFNMIKTLVDLSSSYCNQVIGSGDVLEMDKFMECVNNIDNNLQVFTDKLNLFGRVLFIDLMANIPEKWTEYHNLVLETWGYISKSLSMNAGGSFINEMAKFQTMKMARFFVIVERTIFTLNSKPAINVNKWVELTEKVFNGMVASGYGEGVAFTKVVEQHGFPNIFDMVNWKNNEQ